MREIIIFIGFIVIIFILWLTQVKERGLEDTGGKFLQIQYDAEQPSTQFQSYDR
jgi:hypothetical protein